MGKQDRSTYGGLAKKIDALLRFLKNEWPKRLGEKFSQKTLIEDYWIMDNYFPPGTIHKSVSKIKPHTLSKVRHGQKGVKLERVELILEALEFTIRREFGLDETEFEGILSNVYSNLPDDHIFLESRTTKSKEILEVHDNIYQVQGDLYQELGNSKSEVLILDTAISGLSISKILEHALSNKQTLVKILLANPLGNAFKLRKRSLEKVGLDLDFQYNLQLIAKSNIERIKVRIYDELPGLNLLSTESVSYVGWYWSHQRSNEGPWLRYTNRHKLYKGIKKHFHTLWKDSEEIDPNFYLEIFKADSFPVRELPFKDIRLEPDTIHYRAYFYRDGAIKHFALSYSPAKSLVNLSLAESGNLYSGELLRKGKYCLVVLESKDNDRNSYLIGELDGFQPLKDRELTPFLISSIDRKGRAISGRMFLERIPHLPSNPQELVPASIPLGIRGLLYGSEISIQPECKKGTIKELNDSFLKSNHPMTALLKMSTKWSGYYYLYALHRKKRVLLKYAFHLDEEGNLQVYWNDAVVYKGRIVESLNARRFIIEMHDPDQKNDARFINFLSLSGNKQSWAKGIFVGYSIDTPTSGFLGGRIFIVPSRANEISEIQTEYIPFDSKEFNETKFKFPRIANFFAGEDHRYYLDDIIRVSSKPSLERFPRSEPLKAILGVYEYFYTSVASRVKSKFIRKAVLEIDESGRLKMIGLRGEKYSGAVLIYDSTLYMRFFKETGRRKFQGFAVLKVKSDMVQVMQGITTLTASSKITARKLVCIKVDKTIPELQPEQIHIGSDRYAELNTQYPGLGFQLTGLVGNVIQTPDSDNQETFDDQPKMSDVYFRSACYLSLRNQPIGKILRELENSFVHGFRDQELLEKELGEGGHLSKYRPEILDMIENIPDILITLPTSPHQS